ncbi:MAG: DUF4124 domain-containing protein [Betaproteobacteria bacterium]
MTRAIVLLLLTLSAAHAQVYRWVDEKGTVHYSNGTPPPGAKAKLLDIDSKPGAPSPDSKDCYTIRCQGERLEQRIAREQEAEARRAAQRPPAPPPPRGMSFTTYISLQRGMTEAEMLGYAGPPDLQFRDRHIVTYSYLPTHVDPFTTVVTLISGRISEIERIRKF